MQTENETRNNKWTLGESELEEIAKHTEDTLESYRPGYSQGDGPELAISDLLADLMHYCKMDAIDFNRCLARGQDHFKEESLE